MSGVDNTGLTPASGPTGLRRPAGGRAPVTLSWVSADGTLPALLPAVAGGVALLSSPRAFTVARVEEDGGCTGPDGPVGLVDVFEARAFTAERELRWVREGAGGHGVVLGEVAVGEDDGPASALGTAWAGGKADEALGLEPADIRYVLWGEPAPDEEQRDGWMTLSSGRIGTLRIPGRWPAPRPAGRPARLLLRACEYVAVEPTHGNAYVFDERLVGIEQTVPGDETEGGTDGG
jgi:CRISPR-associated protein (TIGR03984 family)